MASRAAVVGRREDSVARRGDSVARALRVGVGMATLLVALSLLSMVAGLAMVARPEAFLGLGLADPRRAGLEIALAAGLIALAAAMLGRILDLLHDNFRTED